MNIVDVAVERGNRLLQIVDLLIFLNQLPLVGLDVIHQDGLVGLLGLDVLGGTLQTLQQLLLVLVQILHQRLQPLDLLAQDLVLLLRFDQLLARISHRSLILRLSRLEHLDLLLQIEYLNLLLVLPVLVLDLFVLLAVHLGVDVVDFGSAVLELLLERLVLVSETFDASIGPIDL